MKIVFKRFLIKLALIFLKLLVQLNKGFVFIFKILEQPLAFVGGIVFYAILPIYKIYVSIKRLVLKFVFPSRDIRSLATNKYIVHAAIVVIAVAAASQSIYAYDGGFNDFGKNSILFKLSSPNDEEDIVEGIPIHSDLEEGVEDFNTSQMDLMEGVGIEGFNSQGYIGNNYTPKLDTASTRTSIEYYIVQSGDTTSGIAEKFGISLNTLLWANNLTERSYIRPGDKLTILPLSGVSHTVKKGETVAGIAKEYKAEADEIVEFNHLADAGSVAIGQVLVIPGGLKTVYVATAPSYSSGYTSKTYASTGDLLWPVPTSKRITQYFSWQHPAIDIGMPVGTHILAVEAGTIIYSGWGTGYGYEVLVDHGNGFKTRYAHNSRLLVKAGDKVDRGQIIAYSGNTGWSTGPHLHFEVYVNGTRRNPLLYVK